jgi:hypothetical protein
MDNDEEILRPPISSVIPSGLHFRKDFSMARTATKKKKDDLEALQSLDKKLAMVSDLIAGVVHGYTTGLYLYGAAGLGKSFSVFQQLDQMTEDYRNLNTRITAKALFNELEKYPDKILVIEDVERLTDDKDAQSLLRAALWSPPGKDRVVTWVTDKEGKRTCTFRGALIMLTNKSMKDLPELRAVMSRIRVHKLVVSDREMAAQMRRIAAGGFERNGRKLSPKEASVVCEFLIEQCQKAQHQPDLRMFEHACHYFLQHGQGLTRCHWQDLVINHIKQDIAHFRHPVSLLSNEERHEQNREIVRGILKETDDAEKQVALWEDRTGLRKSTFYNRKREVESGEFDV